MPGGADLGYCRQLNGEGNRRIRQYVERGGSYLGFCAGAYYGSGQCEFEVGNKNLEVIGKRELGFYPGICRGLAFPGFAYNSEAGTRAAELKVSKTFLTKGSVPEVFCSYYNGGGVFVDAKDFHDKGVEILAEYAEPLKVDAGNGKASALYCNVSNGGAVLSSTHPEFAAANLGHAKIPGYDQIIEALKRDDGKRIDFLKACLSKLGLEVSQEDKTIPPLSRLHLSSALPAATSQVVSSLSEVIIDEGGFKHMKGENDTFFFEKPSAWSLVDLKDALPEEDTSEADEARSDDDRIPDYNRVLKHIVIHDETIPKSKETPYFNHSTFYASLQDYSGDAEIEGIFGNSLLYGEVVTSTNTLLEKNTALLRRLPTGFTATATSQIAGRGRGSNVWLSPAGSLMFSTVIRHPTSLLAKAPVIFLQYIAAIAIVEGVKTYEPGFETLPLKLKWPNDIYALDRFSEQYVKIGGILVNSHYDSSEFLAVVGIGLNTTNAAPTTSLNALNPPVPFVLEKLLARILVTFSNLYKAFTVTGFNKDLEETYYKYWLHSDQVVTLETEGGARARIKGISSDWGLLVAEELGQNDRATGKRFQLQSDSNSFDFFKGLVKRKM
ncbi:uncharacterized protein KY384_005516 [Bacidia gigantensis]|uniref:uncharacterized protein n=1 Tax=Bacidia gigantensis TaxID=2732470 RepID=UPI001D04527F|nr:uncharacterized protein KY384_005516 [Bacidia gigantensis]KAG8530034.1 hypothetical protein KY384_005516 [Bacidia gigantensis]